MTAIGRRMHSVDDYLFCFAIRHLQYEQDLPISKTMTPWYLTGAFLLGYSDSLLKHDYLPRSCFFIFHF